MILDLWFFQDLDFGFFGISVFLDMDWIPYTVQLTDQM